MLHRGNKESKYKGLSLLGGWVGEDDISYYLRQNRKHLCRLVLLSHFLCVCVCVHYLTLSGVGYFILNQCLRNVHFKCKHGIE